MQQELLHLMLGRLEPQSKHLWASHTNRELQLAHIYYKCGHSAGQLCTARPARIPRGWCQTAPTLKGATRGCYETVTTQCCMGGRRRTNARATGVPSAGKPTASRTCPCTCGSATSPRRLGDVVQQSPQRSIELRMPLLIGRPMDLVEPLADTAGHSSAPVVTAAALTCEPAACVG